MDRLASGIEGFDALVSGGLPVDASVVVQGPPGQEKLAFALTFLAEGLRNGGSGLAVVASQPPESLLAALRSLGVDVDAAIRENRFRVVDWFSWGEETVTDVEERGGIVRTSVDLTNAGAAVSRGIAALTGTGPKRAIVEMLSPAMNVYELNQVYAFAQSTKRKFDRFHFTALFLLEKDVHTPAALSTLHQPFDGVVEIERSRSGDRIIRKIGILHLRDTHAVSDFVPFEFTEQGIRVGHPTSRSSPRETPSVPPPPLPTHPRPEAPPERVRLFMELARERLKADPEDRDALFTLAAALATVDETRGAVRVLERIETIDPDYPGLWAFEMKLFARLGDADRWRRSRERALAASSEAKSMDAVPCPFCHALVAAGSAQCPHCMANLREEADMLRGPEGLVRATVPEIVSRELGTKAPPTTPAASRPVAKSPVLRPVPRSKGLTNGFILERHPVRPIAVPKSGRTNGLTNGVGRTNGLANGLGRTNGLTNGLGGRTNGLTNGLGRTNGLTNGLGRVQGITNGLGNRSAPRRLTGVGGVLQRLARSSWTRYGVPLAVIALLLVPLFFLWVPSGRSYPITIDGQFGDWASVPKIPTMAPAGPNSDIDLVRVAVKDNIDFLSFYLEVQGNVLAGGPEPARYVDAFYTFIDADRSRTTGYHVQGIGADRMVVVDTWGGQIVGSGILAFDPSHGPNDWTGWVSAGSIAAAGAGDRLEFQADWSHFPRSHGPVDVAFASKGWDGQSDAAGVTATSATPYLLVGQDTAAPASVQGIGTDLARFTFTAAGGDVSLRGLNVTFPGTFGPGSISVVDLVDESGGVLSTQLAARVVHFPLSSFQVAVNGTRVLSVRPHVIVSDGSTVGAFLEDVEDVAPATGGVAFLAPARMPESLGYVGSVPAAPAVDGGFGDWTNVTADPVGDVQPQWNPDVDLSAFAFRGQSGDTYFSAQTVGTALNGTMIPQLNPTYTPSSNGTGGNVSTPWPVNGTDLLRFYLDADGFASTGFNIGGLGADYMVEISGKEGLILSSVALRFSGSTPWTWAWAAIGPASAAKDLSRIEARLPGVTISNASRAFFETNGWNGAHDDTQTVNPSQVLSLIPNTVTVARSDGYTPAPSPAFGSSALRALDIAGNQRWFFTSSNPGAGLPCTTNKVASTTAGTTAANTNLNSGETLCFYTPTGQPATTKAGSWELILDTAKNADGNQVLVPNANGGVDAWKVSGVVGCNNEANEWQCVDDPTNTGATIYINSSSSSVTDSLYDIQDWSTAPSPLSVTSVTIEAACRVTQNPPSSDVRIIVKSGATTWVGTTVPICPNNVNYKVWTETLANDPNTGAAWTLAAINALQIGVRDNDATTKVVQVSYVKATVAFAPVYSVKIDLCADAACSSVTNLYTSGSSNTYGNDTYFTTPTIGAQNLGPTERLRFVVTVVAGGILTVRYSGPNPGPADSRVTIPIPEFHEIVIPVTASILMVVVLQRRRVRRAHLCGLRAESRERGVVPRH